MESFCLVVGWGIRGYEGVDWGGEVFVGDIVVCLFVLVT